MRIIVNEFVKVFFKKSMLLIFLGFILLNAGLLYVDRYMQKGVDAVPPASYRALYQDIMSMPQEEALKTVTAQRDKLRIFQDMTFGSTLSEDELFEQYGDIDISAFKQEYNSGDYLRYTDNLWTEVSLYNRVIAEMESCASYGEYLKKIDDDAETMTSISIFSKPGTFSYRNIMKTPEAFAHLKGNTLTYSPSNGIKMATEFLPTDIIAIVMILICVVSMLTREKELRQLGLIKTTFRGRVALIGAKFAVGCLSCALILLLLYGINFTMAYFSYGFGDLDRYIQSVYGYIGSQLSITVIQYCGLFLLTKISVYLLIMSILFFVANLAKKSVQLYLILGVIFGVSAILYYSIQPSSYLSLFKYINPVSFLHTDTLFQNYLNMNLLGYPVNLWPIFIASVIIGIVIFSVGGMYIFCKQKSVDASTSSTFLSRIFRKISLPKLYRTTSVFLHELYKIMIGGKVLLILLLFAGVVAYTYQPMKEIFYTSEDVHYKQYMLELEGPVTDDKLDYLVEEQNLLSQSPGDLTTASKQKALDMVLAHTTYLQEKEGWYLYDSGYKMLTGETYQGRPHDFQMALLAAAMVIACLSYVYSVEHQNGATVLLRCTYKGRRSTFVSKLVISVLIVTLIYMITYAPYFYNVLSAYGTKAISAPACSIEHLASLPHGISILGYLILISTMRYVALLLAMIIIFASSVKLKSHILTLLAASGVLILPLILSMLGIRVFDYLLLNPLLIGNIFSK